MIHNNITKSKYRSSFSSSSLSWPWNFGRGSEHLAVVVVSSAVAVAQCKGPCKVSPVS